MRFLDSTKIAWPPMIIPGKAGDHRHTKRHRRRPAANDRAPRPAETSGHQTFLMPPDLPTGRSVAEMTTMSPERSIEMYLCAFHLGKWEAFMTLMTVPGSVSPDARGRSRCSEEKHACAVHRLYEVAGECDDGD